MFDRTQKIWYLGFHFCNNGISFPSTRTRACRLELLWMVHEIIVCLVYWFMRLSCAWSNGSWDCCVLGLLVHEIIVCLVYWWGNTSYDYCICRSKYLQRQFRISVKICITKFHVNMCDIYKIKKHSQIKAIYLLLRPSLHAAVFRSIISIPHAIVVKLDDVRTRKRKETSFEFRHVFINTLLWLVRKYYLKWFIHVIDDWSILIAFICFALLCVVRKVIVL